ncbi:hypothetical protein DFH08DRAFT_1042786 [Mycena albidolilacea]|uniref:Uncharacterized protein n=1 Tax=Mycena albidolilacea TaxID=1033008 RepID=A0AAD7EZY2_9AGAR|nr:hypothetical protein DFH08DRAFT_1042786 [Mycena albidolilacea]
MSLKGVCSCRCRRWGGHGEERGERPKRRQPLRGVRDARRCLWTDGSWWEGLNRSHISPCFSVSAGDKKSKLQGGHAWVAQHETTIAQNTQFMPQQQLPPCMGGTPRERTIHARSGKGKIWQDDWRGVELRGEMRQGEAPQSATKATPRVLHKQLALRRGEVHRRGRSKAGRRKKSDVTRYRFFASPHHLSSALPPSSPVAVAFVALLTELLLWHSHIPTPLHPFKYPAPALATISVAWVALNRFLEEPDYEIISTRGGSSHFTNYFAGDGEGTCGGWHHNSESVVVFPKVQWDGSSHCRCISPIIVNKNFDVPSGN